MSATDGRGLIAHMSTPVLAASTSPRSPATRRPPCGCASSGHASGFAYIGSSILGSGAGDIRGARVAAVEPATWRERYVVDGGYDAFLTPDGTRLYVATGREVIASDARTGREAWRVTVQIPGYMPGGPSALATSPDGRWLYISSYEPAAGQQGPGWLHIMHTQTGRLLEKTVMLPECRGPHLYTPPSGETLYIMCLGELRLLNTGTQRIEAHRSTGTSSWTRGVLSPDGRRLYSVDPGGFLTIFDTEQRTIRKVNLPRPEPPLGNGVNIALSGDGTRLVVAHPIQEIFGTDNASLFQVFDTGTWNEVTQFRYEQPVVALEVDADGGTIYAAFPIYMPETKLVLPADTIIEFDADDGRVRATHPRANEDIRRIMLVSTTATVVTPTAKP